MVIGYQSSVLHSVHKCVTKLLKRLGITILFMFLLQRRTLLNHLRNVEVSACEGQVCELKLDTHDRWSLRRHRMENSLTAVITKRKNKLLQETFIKHNNQLLLKCHLKLQCAWKHLGQTKETSRTTQASGGYSRFSVSETDVCCP